MAKRLTISRVASVYPACLLSTIDHLFEETQFKAKFVKILAIMDTAAIRQKLHSYLEVADDKKVKAIYAIMENEIKESEVDYSDEFKAELDKGYANFKTGKSKLVTAAKSKRRIQKILKSAPRK